MQDVLKPVTVTCISASSPGADADSAKMHVKLHAPFFPIA